MLLQNEIINLNLIHLNVAIMEVRTRDVPNVKMGPSGSTRPKLANLLIN